ncbi:MAG: DUF2027 domain-containing protein [Siphonobacter sp.]
MNIGDRVRLVHGREEGVITKLLPGDLVEVEIEEGFRIPVQKREVALVSPEENARFRSGSSSEPTKPQVSHAIVANQGIYMAFIPLNDRELVLHLINNSDWNLPYSLVSGSEPHLTSLSSGILKARSTQKVKEWAIKDFENWGIFTFQALFSRPAFMQFRPVLERKIRFRAASFFKDKQRTPILEKAGYLVQLDEQDVIQIHKLKESLTERKTEPAPVRVEKPQQTVDLHIEKLTHDFLAMNAPEMLALQMKTFETTLENAVAHGYDEITFIHGVGNGTLRNELHRRLGKHIHVHYFEDAQKEKFGYGATRVKIK